LLGREALARFFRVADSRQIIFTAGATEGINLVIYGLAPQAKKILSVGFEHNALWRPLEDVARRFGVKVEYIEPLQAEGFNWTVYRSGLEMKPDVVAITHASNITGQIFPLAEMVELAKGAGALVCVDVAQTAGVVPLNFEALNLDFAIFPGHKGLLGPQGIGGVYLRPGVRLQPLRLGGTGSNSAAPQPPEQLPDRYESGTINVPGIAGLAAGIAFLEEKGLEEVWGHEQHLRKRAVAGLRNLGAIIYGCEGPAVGVLSFNFPGLDSAELAFILDDVYDICVRGGLHCCPRGHQSLGTLQQGTVRISPGIYNTEEDIDNLLAALAQVRQLEVKI
jgi:selenocysteine lyase/cysteine desulfurase